MYNTKPMLTKFTQKVPRVLPSGIFLWGAGKWGVLLLGQEYFLLAFYLKICYIIKHYFQ